MKQAMKPITFMKCSFHWFFINAFAIPVVALFAAGQAHTKFPVTDTNPVLWGSLPPGQYNVGFKTTMGIDTPRNERKLFINMWYPTNVMDCRRVSFEEYIYCNSFGSREDAIGAFKATLEIPWILGLGKVDEMAFRDGIKNKMMACSNVNFAKGSFPVVIANMQAVYHSVLFEFLASHGFIVVAVFGLPDQGPVADSLLYRTSTLDLELAFNFVKSLRHADLSRLSAFGFGGAIQAAFYLAARQTQITRLVNLDGGVFMNEAKTTLSTDYKPDQFDIPLLHIVTPGTKQKEKRDQILRLSRARIYSYTINSEKVRHHDFTALGRFAVHGLKMKRDENDSNREEVYRLTCLSILYFLTRSDEALVDFQFPNEYVKALRKE